MRLQITTCEWAIMTGKSYLHGIWLAEIARSTILQQQRPSFRETLYTKCISVAGDYIEK